jgi:hypothetical protein
LAAALALSVTRPVADLVRPGTWRSDRAAVAARSVLDAVPDDASVAASNLLAPQLTDRTRVYLFPMYPDARTRPDWVAVLDGEPTLVAAIATRRTELAALGYHLVVHRDGVALYRRDCSTCVDLGWFGLPSRP